MRKNEDRKNIFKIIAEGAGLALALTAAGLLILSAITIGGKMEIENTGLLIPVLAGLAVLISGAVSAGRYGSRTLPVSLGVGATFCTALLILNGLVEKGGIDAQKLGIVFAAGMVGAVLGGLAGGRKRKHRAGLHK